MTYVVHMHPLSAYCWKVLVAMREAEVEFETVVVDLSSAPTRDGYLRISPMGKIPAIEDRARNVSVHETSIIIEHIALHEPGMRRLLPADPHEALHVRLLDRVFDLYVANAMQKIVLDNIRPEGQRDPFGVAQALREARQVLDWLDTQVTPQWACGATFTMADCAAAPALFYLDRVAPLSKHHKPLAGYLERLKARPSFAAVLQEAEPWFKYFPGTPVPDADIP